jgi:hypothetical protein
MTDLKFKIDLEALQKSTVENSISQNDTTKTKDKKSKSIKKGKSDKQMKTKSKRHSVKDEANGPLPIISKKSCDEEDKKKKKKKKPSQIQKVNSTRNSNSQTASIVESKSNMNRKESAQNFIDPSTIVSLSLNTGAGNNNYNFKSSTIPIKKTKHWEKKWVLIPNVFDFTKEIWLKRWVLVDEEEEHDRDSQENNFYDNYYETQRIAEVVPKKYQCSFEECSKIFIDASSLKKHLLTHGERQYICKHEGCGKKFLDNSKLRRHQLVHTGEKPFKCDLCGKKFSLDFNLKTHLRTHTGEKPYFCSYTGCDKRFTQSSNLTAHEKTHKDAEILAQTQLQIQMGKKIPIFSTKTSEEPIIVNR